MAVPLLEALVPGRVALLTAPVAVAEPWKWAVAEAVAAAWRGAYIQEPCAVDLTFALGPARFADTALFNLLKATVDGLSHALFAPAHGKSPGPWHREDWRIVELHAWKQSASEAPYTRIRIGPPGQSTPAGRVAPIIEGFVAGRPAVWVSSADNAGYRTKFVNALQAKRRATPDELIAARLDFFVEPDQFESADLDNFCVPAAIAACQATFGDMKHPQRLVELRATKAPARTPSEAGTAVTVWPVDQPAGP
jgi:hypothetical protein